jgi:hypothetical protein
MPDRRRRAQLGGLLSATAAIAFGGHAMAEKPRTLAFPIAILPPSQTHWAHVASQAIIASQPFRSLEAIRIKSELPVQVRVKTLDRKFTSGGSTGASLPAGSIFVLALDGGLQVYCAATASRKDGWATYYDVGVCLRDDNADGVFDQIRAAQPNLRVRTPYEITIEKDDVWSPISVAYERLQPDDIPVGAFRVRFFHQKGLLSTDRPDARLDLCWAPDTVYPQGKEGSRELCSQLEWPNVQPGVAKDTRELTAPVGQAETVAWGPLQLRLTRNVDDSVDSEIVQAYPEGMSVLLMTGFIRNLNDYHFQISNFRLLRLTASTSTPAAAGAASVPGSHS